MSKLVISFDVKNYRDQREYNEKADAIRKAIQDVDSGLRKGFNENDLPTTTFLIDSNYGIHTVYDHINKQMSGNDRLLVAPASNNGILR